MYQVIWRGENKKSLFRSDGRIYMRRRVGEALHSDCIEKTTKNPNKCHDLGMCIWRWCGPNSSD